MATILHLKKRARKVNSVTILPDEIARLKAAPDNLVAAYKDMLWESIVAPKVEMLVHDKFQLEMIANWVPLGKETPNGREAGSLLFTEQARWIELALRIHKLDDQKTGKFTLSSSQADLIFNRLTDPRFEMRATDPCWEEFCRDFFTAYGKWPKDHNAEDGFDVEFEPDDEIEGLPDE